MKVRKLLHGITCLCPILTLFSGLALAQGNRTTTGNKLVDKLLSEMTLKEKLSMIRGAVEISSTNQGEAGYLPGIPRLGIPPLRFADGPPGVLTRVKATAPTATMGLAATFSLKDARLNGILIGREARDRGVNVVLEPFINMDRDLRFSRSYNTFGEDPLLTGQIGASEIRGIQSEGIMAQAKHYIAYDSDADGHNVIVSQRALHEIYLPPFVDAVNAGVASIMCSYNKVNGRYACGNSETLTRILRGELKFKGFVTSDWGATHANTFINAGEDLEMPGPRPDAWSQANMPSYFDDGPDLPPLSHVRAEVSEEHEGIPEEPTEKFDGFTSRPPGPVENMRDALRSGAVTEATVTRAVSRILLQMDRFGLLKGSAKPEIKPNNVGTNASIILKTGEDSAVLLKNDNGVLPLKQDDLESLALIGPGAGQTIAVGLAGEKAVGLPARQTGVVEVLKKYFAHDPNVHITYAVADDMTGSPVPAEYLSHGGKSGLVRTSGRTGATLVDRQLDFTHKSGEPLADDSTYRWKGSLNIPSAGTYDLYLQVLGAFSSLHLDGRELVANSKMEIHGDITQAGQDNVLPTTDGLDNLRVGVPLQAGPHSLEVDVAPDSSNDPIQVRLSWVTPEQRKENYQAAVNAAKRSKVAIVFAWSRGKPDFQLPGDQDRLIEDVAAVNPNTVVALNISQPVAMPWLDKVKALLQMWWPGDEGGFATANVLLGRANPAGRLPFTWPRRLGDTAAGDRDHPERSQLGVNGKTTYSEGIFVGYRWSDSRNIKPLFPFGFGLSYAHFQYSDLKATHTNDGGLDVSFNLTNVSRVAGDEVPQLYVGAPKIPQPSQSEFAVRALAAFKRIALGPGQSRMVTLHIPPRSLQYWSAISGRWITATGPRPIFIGASSRDLRLTQGVTIIQ